MGEGTQRRTVDLLRSEPMQLVQLIIPNESAHCTISYLGDLGLFQFKDLNSEKSPFQRTYATQIKSCGEMARKLRFFKEQMTKAGLSPLARSEKSDDVDLDHLEVKLGELEAEVIEMNANQEKLEQSYNEIIEYKLVVQKAGEFFHSAQSNAAAKQREVEAQERGEGTIENLLLLEQEMVTDPSKQVKQGFISDLVPREKSLAFERILFRATRGNVFLKQSVVEDPVTDPPSGEKGSGRLEELKTTIDVGLVKKEKSILSYFEHPQHRCYKKMSCCTRLVPCFCNKPGLLMCNPVFSAAWHSFLIAVTKLKNEGLIPLGLILQIQNVLQQATVDSNSQVGIIFHVLQTKESPPTYFNTNNFTSAFQEIVDAYGTAKYQEANPGVFTIVTFPFLFAVMFGDWGHGICLLLATSYFIIREKEFSSQKLGDVTEMIFGGRYVITMMALFSIYTGLIYNEFFSVPLELCGPSAYGFHDPSCRDASTAGLVKVHATYPFGVEPKWHGNRSELPFLNSLKMKMSILLGSDESWNHIELLQCNFFSKMYSTYDCATASSSCFCTVDIFPKPFLLKKQHDERHHGESYPQLDSLDDPVERELHHGSNSHEEIEFSEAGYNNLKIFSNPFLAKIGLLTASDLFDFTFHSLAHSELSSVFYDKVLLLAWGFNNIFILLVGIFVFICATVGVLLVMETLSAFLHALGLHWVEFQNKFYEGDRYKFQPFSLALLREEDE
ncbi:hypothetical protein REPUB_Repub19eG0022400 [Reevesia pubescens]